MFAESNIELIIACSFAKNFGLYGERTGVLHILTNSIEVIPNIASQLRVISRSLYSTCPSYGARIVATILSNELLALQWENECKEMADRILLVRKGIYQKLNEYNVKGKWEHVINQNGMFSYTGIPSEAVKRLKSEFHIYLLDNGRISLAGLNSHNITRFAESLAIVLGTN